MRINDNTRLCRSSSPMEAGHEKWKEICLRFFRDGDATAREAVGFFERAQAATDDMPAGTASPAAMNMLEACGLGNIASLSPDEIVAFVSAKNSVRSEVHTSMENARKKRLSVLIAQYCRNASGAPESGESTNGQLSDAAESSKFAPLSSIEASNKMQSALRRFISSYAADPAAWPFLKGLATLVHRQRGHPTVWRWSVRTEHLTERGFPTFMEDVVPLLMGYFRYVAPHDEETGGGVSGILSNRGNSVPVGSHAWDVEHSLSDRQLTRMMTVLRRAVTFDTGTSGEFYDTGIARTNQDGELDESDDSICPSCFFL